MPVKPTKPCVYPRCPALIPLGEKYCPKHKAAELPTPCKGKRCAALVQWPEKYCAACRAKWLKKYDFERGSAASRGYGPKWKRFRAAYVADHPICEVCKARGQVTPTTEVHHILPVKLGGILLDKRNCIAVCTKCHRELERDTKKTNSDQKV